MLTAETLRGVHLSSKPWVQRCVAWAYLWPNYSLPKRTHIVIEGLESLPDHPVIFAMNHTDAYNYWPFQYEMYMRGYPRFIATWVKGKYYEKPLLARFLMSTNNIPIPSRGYVITTRFRKHLGRPPTEAEYRLLRDLVDGRREPEELREDEYRGDLGQFFAQCGNANTPRTALIAFEREFSEIMAEVVRLNSQALTQHNCNLLIFPEGTRSLRLAPGRTGLIQMAQHLNATVVPVGCNGSNKIYPGDTPWARGGKITYRIGQPMTPEGPELGDFRVGEAFVPLTREASMKHGASFARATDVIMEKINALLDPEYQHADSPNPDTRGVHRFI